MRNKTNRLFEFLFGMVLLLGCCDAANAVTPMVAAGSFHSLGLSSDGKVYGWGSDAYGQLGLGTALIATAPQSVPSINLGKSTGKSRVASGGNHNVAVASDGIVWTWGNNGSGQLGDGTTTNRSSPVQVPGLTGVVAVAAGAVSTYAVKSDGSVWAWGGNSYGQLGDGTTTSSSSPVQMQGLSGVVAIAAADWGIYVVKSDGSVWALGWNNYGQLGDGTTTDRSLPVQVPGLSGVVAIAASEFSTYAVKSDGTVWAWGGNFSGQLGDGTTTDQSLPVRVRGLSGVVAVAAEYSSAFAVKSDGTVWAWGDNFSGQLGDGTTTNRSSPVQVPGLSGVIAVTSGGNTTGVGASTAFSFAVKSDGTVWAWGDNSSGQLGDGTTISRSSPVQVHGLTGVVAVVAGIGPGNGLALKPDGSVWAWGNNFSGQLGNGTTATDHTVPVQVPGLAGVMAVASGEMHSLAVKSDGSVWAWGNNSVGQLGDGTTTSHSSPKQVPGLSGVVAVATEWGFGSAAGLIGNSFALKSDGSLWAWGNNIFGQLGDGTYTNRSSPVQVPGLSGVVAVATGNYITFAVKSDGTVWAWGDNSSGQFGLDPTITSHSTTPVRVPGLTGVVAVAAVTGSSFAVKSDGSIWSWGSNWFGELGEGTFTPRFYPAQVPGLTGAVAITAGSGRGNIIALKSDGSAWAWGDNSTGELGDGTFALRSYPVLAVNPSVNGFLSLSGRSIIAPPALNVPFFVASSGGITTTSATVKTTTQFNAADVGKSGAVYITAMVPSGSTKALSMSLPARIENKGFHAKALATLHMKPLGGPSTTFVQMQLTSSGWQQVTNGQLIPYATGVLGDQLAAQTILNNTATSNLKGAQFCLGYGASATDMAGTGRMRVVATIPDPNATSQASCLPVSNAQLFAYATGNYPSLFSGAVTSAQVSYQGNTFDYQYFSATQNYLAVNTSGMVYIMGPVSGGALKPVAAVSSFADIIYAWQAAQAH